MFIPHYVTCHLSHMGFCTNLLKGTLEKFDKVVEIVGGVSVINGLTSSILFILYYIIFIWCSGCFEVVGCNVVLFSVSWLLGLLASRSPGFSWLLWLWPKWLYPTYSTVLYCTHSPTVYKLWSYTTTNTQYYVLLITVCFALHCSHCTALHFTILAYTTVLYTIL